MKFYRQIKAQKLLQTFQPMQKKLSMGHNDDKELCKLVGKNLEDDNIATASPG